MTPNWSLLLSVFAVILGLISAYGRLKRIWLWLKRSSSKQVEEYKRYRDNQVSNLANNTSYLVAYGLRRTLWIIALTYLASIVEISSDSSSLWTTVSVYTKNGLYVITGALLGNILGDLKHIESAAKKK